MKKASYIFPYKEGKFSKLKILYILTENTYNYN